MSVTQTRDTVLSAVSTATEDQMAGIRSRLLKALVFEILAIVVSVIGSLYMVGSTIAMATEDHFAGVTLYFGYLADGIPAAFFLSAAVLSLVLSVRVWRMLSAASSGDVATLRRLNSLGWVAIAFVFSWIVPGVYLLRANRLIREASA
jgi:hypothetical protein